jgi:hypothetical protein
VAKDGREEKREAQPRERGCCEIIQNRRNLKVKGKEINDFPFQAILNLAMLQLMLQNIPYLYSIRLYCHDLTIIWDAGCA